MGEHIINLSDIGEGVAEAELVEWHVSVGDSVTEDQILGVVMTDKAAVELPSSVLGTVVRLCADVGDVVAVGSPLVYLEVDGELALSPESNIAKSSSNETESSTRNEQRAGPQTTDPNIPSVKVLAAPSVRQAARQRGVDLATLSGSGPGGRILHSDLESIPDPNIKTSRGLPDTSITNIKVVGLRRKIAEKMSISNSRIPHITIVEEVDVQSLEDLREELNQKYSESRGKLTLLPFVMKSIAKAVKEQPEFNAHFDDDAGSIAQYGGVHLGVATQTPQGLVVPVVRHCEINSLWENASDVSRLAAACRDGTAQREELSGSTITLSSLGPLGAIATTPIINHPEVAIIGINKMVVRPVWIDQQFIPRKSMNLSCSFDHRVIDGWDAAVFVRKLKTLLESPAMLLVEE